jgi:DNA-binding MarR family transcriptional regulator
MRQPDELHLAAWVAFLRAHSRLTRVLDAELRDEAGLLLSWYDVLVQLHAAGDRMRMSELAQSLLLSRSATSRLVDRVERAGYVRREVVEDDARGREVILTDEGLAMLRSAAQVHLRGIAEHFAAHVSDDEARSLAALGERLADLHS